ncbi:hypothetical protein [Anaerosporomusa subterranea]|uniref:hypothetical protein n=1 Tax=Anaerosporomusa subterranea TaxID=1794912 RepID=UPI0012E88DB9|nr:hypothetical protein [Anaerosporomusa subterranea]
MPEKATTEAENSQFTNQFAKISEKEDSQGPWEHEQPLTPRPKSFSINEPDMMGG